MDRRTFIRAATAAGLTIAAAPARQSLAQDSGRSVNRAIVVGAGIVGASIAYNLAKRGCDVTLLDQRGPASQASGNSFAWINASWFDMPPAYFWLRTHALSDWHRLQQEIDIPVHWGGSLEWYHDEASLAEMRLGIERIQQWGAPAWLIDQQRAAEIEPHLDSNSELPLAWMARDGATDPAVTTHALVGAMTAHGGSAIFPATVTDIEKRGTAVRVITEAETFEADVVIVAAGANANSLASMIDLGTDLVVPATPGIIVTTQPMERILNTVCYTSDSHFHQLPDGRVLIGEKTGAPDTEEHRALLGGRPNAYPTPELAAEHADRLLATAGRYVPQLEDAQVERVGVGWRPLPLDGLPTVGHVPGDPRAYLASMHSGVTLGPLIGHLAAMEILDGVRVDMLSDFRVERFL